MRDNVGAILFDIERAFDTVWHRRDRSDLIVFGSLVLLQQIQDLDVEYSRYWLRRTARTAPRTSPLLTVYIGPPRKTRHLPCDIHP